MGLSYKAVLFLGLDSNCVNIPSFLMEYEHEGYWESPSEWWEEAESKNRDLKGLTLLYDEDEGYLIGFLIDEFDFEDDWGQSRIINYKARFLDLEEDFRKIFNQDPELYFYNHVT